MSAIYHKYFYGQMGNASHQYKNPITEILRRFIPTTKLLGWYLTGTGMLLHI